VDVNCILIQGDLVTDTRRTAVSYVPREVFCPAALITFGPGCSIRTMGDSMQLRDSGNQLIIYNSETVPVVCAT
jgi:hypothetical protein